MNQDKDKDALLAEIHALRLQFAALQKTRTQPDDEDVCAKEKIRLEKVLASLDTGLCVINRDLSLAWVNEKAKQNFHAHDWKNVPCHEFFESRTTPCDQCPVIKAFQSGNIEEIEHFNTVTKKWYAIMAQPIQGDGSAILQVLESITDITPRKQYEEALIKSEQKWKHILINAPQIGISLDTKGQIIFANEHFLKITGWKNKEILGKDWFNTFIHPIIRNNIRNVFDITMSQKHTHGYSNHENDILHRDGSTLTISWSNVLTLDAKGYPVDVTCLGIDVTERRRAEKALRISENTLKSIFRAAPVGMGLITARTFSKINEKVCEITGYSEKEILGQNAGMLYVKEKDFEYVEREKYRQMAERGTGTVETKWKRKDGKIIDVLLSSTPLDQKDWSQGISFTALDITTRKETERVLADARNEFENIFANSQVGIMLLRAGRYFSRGNQRLADILGYASPEEMNGISMRDLHVSQDNFQNFGDRYYQKLVHGEQTQIEYQLKKKDGSPVWCTLSGKALDKNDLNKGVIWVVDDLTKRKALETQLTTAKEAAEEANRALQINMTHLRALVEAMPELVWLKDVNGVYIFCNKRFEKFFGASETDIIGKTDYDFVKKDLADFFKEHDKTAMKAGRPTINEETITYKDDGHTEEVETIKTPISDDQGQVVGVLGVARDMTERNRIAKELKESEDRFKALHNASFGGIAIHNKGIILDCNQGLADISGYSMEELVGMDGVLLIAESSRKMVVRNILAGCEKPYEALGVRKNGEEYPIRLEAKNIPYKGQQARAVEFRDITAQKKAEEKLKDSELRHRVIFENSPLGMIRFSQEGRILDCNDHFIELMGASREKLIGFNTLTQSNKSMQKALRKAIDGHPSTYEDYYTSVTGNKTIYLRVQFNPVNQGKIPTEVIATLEDYSDRKEFQDHLKNAKEEAEKANHAKSMFLANMSHELRTPLNGIMGMLQLLKSTNLNTEQREYVTLAIQSAQRLTGLLGDILDLTKIESGKMSVVEKSLNLSEAFDLAGKLFGPSCDQKGIELRFDYDNNIPKELRGDPIRLQQILNNLIGNAVKFTDTGRITCEASLLSKSKTNEVRVFFAVSDTGIGMEDANINYLFSEFTQADESYRRSYQGAGLGLSIVRRLITLLGGHLAVESELGTGTTFSFSIPFKVDTTHVYTPSNLEKEKPKNIIYNQTILLVEDEFVNQVATKSILEKAGMRVVAVNNGKEALNEIANNDYDLILMDIQMPVMDGVEATRKIRNGAAGETKKNIPIIALTAYAMDGDKESFIRKGINEYITKPVNVSILMSTISKIFK